MSPTNRRRHPRARVRNVVAHAPGPEGRRRIWVVDNISAGGVFVKTQEVLPVGSSLEMDIVQPGMKRALKLKGRVVLSVDVDTAKARRAAPGMGIEFENMSEDMSRRLQEVLETLRIPQQAAPLVRDLHPTSTPSRAPASLKTPSSDEIPLAAIKRRQQRRIAARGILAHLRARGEVVALGLAIQDLSTGGLFAQCEEPCPVGTKVELELFRPNQPQPLFLAGEVVSAVTKSQAEFRRIKPGMSVRFDPMALSSFTRLRNILAELVPAAADELRQAPPARDLLPEPEPEPRPPPSYQVTPEIDAARRANFEFNSVEIPVEEAGLHRAEDVHQELERLRTEVKERVQRIAELEAHLLAQQKTS